MKQSPRPLRLGLPLLAQLACVAMAVAAVWAPATAQACAACLVGDPTITAMGTEQPYAGRLRAALEFSHRTDAVGAGGEGRVELSEQRFGLSATYAPIDWLALSLTVPIVHRTLEYENLGSDTFTDLGDMEARARFFLYRDSSFAPTHLIALTTGVELPTAPVERDPNGQIAQPELQAGSGSVDPSVGVSYSFFAEPWSLYLSEVLLVPTRGSGGWRVGTTWRSSHVLQYQLTDWLGLSFSADWRLEEATEQDGQREPDSGGFIAFAAPGVLFNPLTDLVFNAGVQIPVINALDGTHDEGPVLLLGTAYDF